MKNWCCSFSLHIKDFCGTAIVLIISMLILQLLCMRICAYSYYMICMQQKLNKYSFVSKKNRHHLSFQRKWGDKCFQKRHQKDCDPLLTFVLVAPCTAMGLHTQILQKLRAQVAEL